uniref:Uncharacterized protein n=1 Tax=Rhizophora mucronata TaxID=61149 RepID=A0A2P2J1Q3_RHIMU
MLLNCVKKMICLWVQPPSVQAKHSKRSSSKLSILNQNNIFSPTESNGDVITKFLECLIYNLQRRSLVQSFCQQLVVLLLLGRQLHSLFRLGSGNGCCEGGHRFIPLGLGVHRPHGSPPLSKIQCAAGHQPFQESKRAKLRSFDEISGRRQKTGSRKRSGS